MKRGKKFFENENILIYMGMAIFLILAVSLGIIMYMMTNTSEKVEIGENTRDILEKNETTENENTENASTDIGKTIEEQENSNIIEEENPTSIETDEPDTNTQTNAPVEQNISTEENTETPAVTETKKEVTFIKPAEGEIICEFAKDNLIYSETLKEWITHTAIDIKADKTSVIKSAESGIIKSIVNDPRYGLTVVIEHDDGYQTVYSNLLTAEFVVEGEEVEQGQTIGTVGNTASFESSMESHLHFELLKDGEYLDPSIYLK